MCNLICLAEKHIQAKAKSFSIKTIIYECCEEDLSQQGSVSLAYSTENAHILLHNFTMQNFLPFIIYYIYT